MNTPTPAPSWPTRMAAIFNEWARRYSESPDSFGDVLGPDGKPVEDYGQRCATYFEQISRELYPSVKCTDPAQALANAALDWCEERGPRDRGDAELLKAIWNYSGDYVGPCAGCDGSCDEACAQSLTVAQAHAAIDRALEAHRAKIADVEERRSQRIQRLAQQAQDSGTSCFVSAFRPTYCRNSSSPLRPTSSTANPPAPRHRPAPSTPPPPRMAVEICSMKAGSMTKPNMSNAAD